MAATGNPFASSGRAYINAPFGDNASRNAPGNAKPPSPPTIGTSVRGAHLARLSHALARLPRSGGRGGARQLFLP